MLRRLDRSKHYAEVRNHPEIWYSQDGVDFDFSGVEIVKEKKSDEEEVKKPQKVGFKK